MTDTKPATKPQLIALRDTLLRWKDRDAAAAADNLIDILSRAAIPSEWYAICPQCKTGYDERFTNCLVCNSQLIRPYVEPDGCGNGLHPYDFTPVPPDMPIIDMDSIEEIPF